MPGWEQPGLGIQVVHGRDTRIGKLRFPPYGGHGFGPPEVWFSKENLAPITGVMWALIDRSVGVDFGTAGYAYMTGATMLSPGGYNIFLNEGYSQKYTGDPQYGLAMMFCDTSASSCAWQALVEVQAGAARVTAASAASEPVANNNGVKSNDGTIYASFAGTQPPRVRHLVLVAHDTARGVKEAILAGGGYQCTQVFPFNGKSC